MTPQDFGAVADGTTDDSTAIQPGIDALSVADFGAVGDGVTDDTIAIQAAIDWCATNGKKLEFRPTGIYAVSALSTSYNSSNNSLKRAFHIDLCGSTLLSTGSSSDPLLTLLNAKNVTISNGTLDGACSLVQSVLCKIWANNGTSGSSFCVLRDIRFAHAQYGLQAGDAARANEPSVSENTLYGCSAIGVLNPVIVYGVQAELNIVGGNMCAGTNGWVTLPGTYTVNALTAVGGNIRMTGGEITSYVNQGVCIRPIVSSMGNLYGKVFCVQTWCETQNRLAVAENPGSVSSPAGGLISFVQCAGNIAQNDGSATMDSAGDFPGVFTVTRCNFFATIMRTQPNINIASGGTIRVDSESFNTYLGTVPANGPGFISGIGGFTGGKLFYDSVVQVTAMRVEQNAAQSLPNGAWTKIQLQHELFDTNSNFDSTTNHRFLVEDDGIYHIDGHLQIDSSGSPPGVDIYVNGVSVGYNIGGYQPGQLNGTASVSHTLKLTVGDYVEMYGIQISGGSKNTSGNKQTQMSVVYLRAA